jgi:hypothetical protein
MPALAERYAVAAEAMKASNDESEAEAILADLRQEREDDETQPQG